LEGINVTRKLYRVPEAANALNISAKSIWNWISQGRIGVTRIGGRAVRIPQAEIDRLIDEGYSPARRTA
jgi:excisionase family DNA binding protein